MVLEVELDHERDVFGLADTPGGGTKPEMTMLTDPRNRGVADASGAGEPAERVGTRSEHSTTQHGSSDARCTDRPSVSVSAEPGRLDHHDRAAVRHRSAPPKRAGP